MVKKEQVMLLTFIVLFIISFVSAEVSTTSDSTTSIDKAYSCLSNQLSKKSTFTLQEAIFGTLALGNNKNLTDIISDNKASSSSCWPSSGCKIKETAQVLLAYNRIGKDTSSIKSWLLSSNSTTTDLSWYLEIDIENHSASSCTIKYPGGTSNIRIQEDMTLTGSAGSCFTISSSGYLLRVRDSCLDKTFEVSCDNSFVSALLYQKNKGSNVDCLDEGKETCYVLGNTNSAPSLGTTEEEITASCFKNSGVCDYEGTLWAVLALQKLDQDIGSFIPYLVAFADDYERYFSHAFISNILGGLDDISYSKVISLRKQNQYWDLDSSPYNRFYDTALGMLALGSGANQDELAKTQNYLLSIQTKDGCWNNNNFRDTAFLLYSGWKKMNVPGSGSGTGTLASTSCIGAGFSCEKLSDCTGAGGSLQAAYECSGVSICCSIAVPKPTCESQNGKICSSQTECSGQIFEASDTQGCCLGSCIPISSVSQCEQSGGFCADSCISGETETSDSCSSSSQICCIQSSEGGSSGTWWIIILIILIILVVLAILFRHRIQMWWFSRKSGSSVKPISRQGPSSPPSSSTYRPVSSRQGLRQMSPFVPRQVQPSVQSRSKPPISSQSSASSNKEYEETLRKLKDMSK